MSKFDGLYNIRSAVPGDRNLVLKSFLLGVYYGNSWFNRIPKTIFMEHYKQVAAALFDNPSNLVVIACLPEDPDTVLGYSIVSSDGTTLHWVYVKEKWRKHGVMSRIVPNTVTTVTHLSDIGESILKKFNKSLIFNPFQLT
jgi:hypothetical protein